MKCPNGHKGGLFCCEDHFNQAIGQFWKKHEDYCREVHYLIPVTLDQWEAYEKLLKEQGDEQEKYIQDTPTSEGGSQREASCPTTCDADPDPKDFRFSSSPTQEPDSRRGSQ